MNEDDCSLLSMLYYESLQKHIFLVFCNDFESHCRMFAYILLSKTLWVLSNMPNRPVRDQWEYPRKMERHFPIKPGQPIGTALTIFYSFSEFPTLIRANNRFVKNGTANFGHNIPTEISGPATEEVPNIPVGRNRNGPSI